MEDSEIAAASLPFPPKTAKHLCKCALPSTAGSAWMAIGLGGSKYASCGNRDARCRACRLRAHPTTINYSDAHRTVPNGRGRRRRSPNGRPREHAQHLRQCGYFRSDSAYGICDGPIRRNARGQGCFASQLSRNPIRRDNDEQHAAYRTYAANHFSIRYSRLTTRLWNFDDIRCRLHSTCRLNVDK
jgi:hypothetical protein